MRSGAEFSPAYAYQRRQRLQLQRRLLGTGGGWGGWGSSGGRPVVFEPPREYAAGYAKNDGDFIPSVYMNYEDALALGKQMLADEEARAHGEGTYSLAEAARAARMAKVPTLRLKSRIIQDNAGKMLVCNLNGNDCRKVWQTP